MRDEYIQSCPRVMIIRHSYQLNHLKYEYDLLAHIQLSSSIRVEESYTKAWRQREIEPTTATTRQAAATKQISDEEQPLCTFQVPL